ncbi:MAG: hypothetical protein AAFR87_01685 [Bacteroidota bacterium]
MRTILSILLISFCGYISAAKYTIIETIGIVKLCDADRQLYHGDVINVKAMTQLCLIDKGDTTAMAVLVNDETRINYVLMPIEIKGKKKNELIPLRADGFTFNMKRPTNSTEELKYLKSTFSLSKRVVLGDEFSVPIRHLAIPRKLAPFRLDYTYKGKRVTKYMYTRDNQLAFKKSKIYVVDGNPINPREAGPLSVYYRYETYTKLGTFTPNFVEKNMIKKEIDHFLKFNPSALQPRNKPKTINNILHFMSLLHGIGDTEVNRNWVIGYLNTKARRRATPGRARLNNGKVKRNN